MANMRVHELAKELNITSKDITDMLSNSEKTYKSVSGLTDAEISSVRKKFAPAPKVENKPAAQPAKQSQPVKNDNRTTDSRIRLQSSHSREHRISLVMLMIRSISHRYISTEQFKG